MSKLFDLNGAQCDDLLPAEESLNETKKLKKRNLAAQQQPQVPYGGQHKVIAAAAEDKVPACQQRQMTDAERLKADKEQLKLNLQNFRKTQKTAKQLQLAKQAAAIQAQKSQAAATNNSGLNSTYQAFDLQNYKTPADCFIGLQSAKKMLQQQVFQGTTSTVAPNQQQAQVQAAEQPQLNGSQTYQQNNTKSAQQPSQLGQHPRQPQNVHHPPPSNARRKRGHDFKENENTQHVQQRGAMAYVQQATPPVNLRRQGRFVPQMVNNQQNNRTTATGVNQNLHPNITPASSSPKKQSLQHKQEDTQSQLQPQSSTPLQTAQHQQHQVQVTPASPIQTQSEQITNLSEQLAKIAGCLNYDKGEILSLFQQKCQELMTENHHATWQKLQLPGQEHNLGVLLQFVQNDLLMRHKLQQQQQQMQAQQQMNPELLPTEPAAEQQQHLNNQTRSQQQTTTTQVSNPSQTSEQHGSVSSTFAVINNDDVFDEVDNDEQVNMISDDEDQSPGLYAHQSVNCFPGDQTEAYEANSDSQQNNQQQLCVDQHYHQFGQSDYVEAVEGYNPEDEEDQEVLEDDGSNQGDDDDLAEDEYIEEEHQFTLNELYAQAHKQLLANGLGSKDDIRAWQALYPRLIGGGITPQGLEQMINLGQANLTQEQAQEIFTFQQKQMGQNSMAAQNQESEDIVIDEETNQQDPNQYDWCSQDSDEESQYDQEVEDANNSQNQAGYSDDMQGSSFQDQQNLIYSTLQPPSHLSPGFKRFFSEFENNIDFILRWDYEILPSQRSNYVCKAEQKRLKNKYENLLTASRDMCRRFTGPHSVLQIFIEKIVASINFVAEQLKDSTLKEFGLWKEIQVPLSSTQQQQQQRKQQASSVLIGHPKRSSSANPELLITKTSKTSNDSHQQPAQQEQKEQLPPVQQFTTVLTPKPLLECIDQYALFLDELRTQYLLIMKTCAPKISKHFTKLTAVIVENTQYEFPSTEIHKAVISKLILNDQKYFKQLVTHLQQDFQARESLIREQYPDFVNALELFLREVDDDMRANQTKIEIYMRDLRKHALDEYEDLYRDEQEMLKQGHNGEGKKKRKKRKRKNKNALTGEEANVEDNDTDQQAQTIDDDPGSGQPQASQRQQELDGDASKNSQTNDIDIHEGATIENIPSPTTLGNGGGKKKKRNRRKNKKQDSVTNELLNNLDTDDLVDFINSCGSKKEDIRKQNNESITGESPSKSTMNANNDSESCHLTQPSHSNPPNYTTETHPSQVADSSEPNSVIPKNSQMSKRKRMKLRAKGQAAEELKAKQNAQEVQNSEQYQTQSNVGNSNDIACQEGTAAELQEEETASDIAFEEKLAQYRSLIEPSKLLSNFLRMKPNVNTKWIRKVRNHLQKLEEKREKRRAHSQQAPSCSE